MISFVIMDMRNMLNYACNLIRILDAYAVITPKQMVECLVLVGNSEDLDLSFWSHIEDIIQNDELGLVDIKYISTVVEIGVENLYEDIRTSTGLCDPGCLYFDRWIGDNICMTVK